MGVDSPFAQIAKIPEVSDYRFRIEFWAILGCVVLFIAIFELVRRNRLRERYSFLWFLTAGVLLVFTVRRDWLEDLARVAGVYYPPTALFLILAFFLLLILIHFSTVISGLLHDKQRLAQSVGLLESRVRELETRLSPGGGISSTVGAGPEERDR
jgi:hypothetical protein